MSACRSPARSAWAVIEISTLPVIEASSARASHSGLPVSRAMVSAMAGARASSSALNLRTWAMRISSGVSAQPGKASRAAATACATSAASASGPSQTSAPVAGSIDCSTRVMCSSSNPVRACQASAAHSLRSASQLHCLRGPLLLHALPGANTIAGVSMCCQHLDRVRESYVRREPNRGLCVVGAWYRDCIRLAVGTDRALADGCGALNEFRFSRFFSATSSDFGWEETGNNPVTLSL